MPSLDYEFEKTAFREFYNDNHQRLRDAEDFFRSLLATLVARVEGLEKPTVTSRLKDREECIQKFSRKYQTSLEQDQKPYQIAPYITDLIGLRIVCLYEHEVELVVDTLRTNFEVLDESNKIEKIESTENTFGYKGFHLDLKANKARLEFPEYSQFKDLQFEVQVRTTIQDAWSALDHKIKYKKSIPPNLKRRINTLAALFELADHEFLSIRKQTQELITKATTASPAISQTEVANGESVSIEIHKPLLDVFSFLSVVNSRFDGYNFLPHAADGFVQELLRLNPKFTSTELATNLDQELTRVKKYKAESPHTLNPYTQIRHSLYLSDPNAYKVALFDMQRMQFDAWLKSFS